MKKRITALLTAAVLCGTCLMSGCGQKNENISEKPVSVEPAATEAPAPTPAPETTPATALVDDLPAVLLTLEAGEEVEVSSESDEYYLCRVGDKKLYVEKRFVRLAAETKLDRVAYIGGDTELFDDVYLAERSKYSAENGTQVTVFAEMDICVGVRFADGTVKYARTAEIYDEDPTKKYYYSAPEPQDGGDIQLVSAGDFYFAYLSGRFPAKGYIKADGVEAYECFFYRGDLLDVIGVRDGAAEILYFDQVLTVPEKLIRGHDKPVYVAWEGYTQKNAPLYFEYRMQTEPELAELNSIVVVLEKFDDSYYVELNGRRGFMPLDSISETENTASQGYSGGGYDHDDDSGEWTPPAL